MYVRKDKQLTENPIREICLDGLLELEGYTRLVYKVVYKACL